MASSNRGSILPTLVIAVILGLVVWWLLGAVIGALSGVIRVVAFFAVIGAGAVLYFRLTDSD